MLYQQQGRRYLESIVAGIVQSASRDTLQLLTMHKEVVQVLIFGVDCGLQVKIELEERLSSFNPSNLSTLALYKMKNSLGKTLKFLRTDLANLIMTEVSRRQTHGNTDVLFSYVHSVNKDILETNRGIKRATHLPLTSRGNHAYPTHCSKL